MDIKKLKASPIFNLSLSSKELFHSNFIDWLVTVDRVQMSTLLSNILKDHSNILKDYIIISDSDENKREKNNFDLYIPCENNVRIVIENKFKSIITEQQLSNYNDKLNKEKSGKTYKILLSLNDSAYEQGIAKAANWSLLNYSQLADELEKITLSNPYHQDLLKDYIFVIKEISAYFLHKFYGGYTISAMHEDYSLFSQIRLQDIAQKILFTHILQELNERLVKEKVDFVHGREFSKPVSTWQDFTRGTGLVALNKTISTDDEFRLELQLQYHSLKVMLIHKNPRSEELAIFRKNYFNFIEELANSEFARKKEEIYPKPNGKKKYNQYGKNCIYKSIVLNEKITIDEIIDLMYTIFRKIIDFGDNWEKNLK